MTAGLPDIAGDVIAHTADAIGRTGAKALEIGFLDDEPPHRWYATAMFRGVKVSCDNQPDPAGAVLGVYAMLAAGGTCAACGRMVAVEHGAAGLTDGARMVGGVFQTRRAMRARHRYCIRRYDGGWPACGK